MKPATLLAAAMLMLPAGLCAEDNAAKNVAAAKSAYSAGNVASGYRLAGAYQQLGAFQAGQGGVPGALQNYHEALIILNRIALGNPADPRIRGELLGVAGRVRALGGTIPVWINLPLNEQPEPEQAAPRVAAPEPAPALPLPDLDTAKLSGNERKSCEDAVERYVLTAATAQAARSVLADLRASVQSHGLSLRSDYVTADARIHLRMQQARRAIETRDCPGSVEPLTIAGEEVRRLLRELGQ